VIVFEKERWLVTAALPYVNNIPHVGNIVGSHLPADIFSRFLRLFGNEVVFVGGTDEHGSPTEVAAFKAGLQPKDFCDRLYQVHKLIYEWFGISYDNFSRTSKEINHKVTTEIFLRLLKNGFIIRKKLLLPYCPVDKRFLPDRWIEGTCPYCGYRPARGDQCESCTRLLDPSELLEPYCIICKNKPEIKEVEHLFLDLPKLEKKLEEWIKGNKHWKPNVRNLALSWIKEGLKPRCISRDLKWGIQIPLEGFKDKVFYCWFDAPIGYISSTVEWAERIGKPEEWRKYWQEKDSKIVHFIGKDNIVFHTIIWPAILMGTGEFNLPYQVGGLEFLNYEGDKISKSRNWGVFLDVENGRVIVKVGDKKIDLEPDYLRFYLSLIMPETKDSNFVWKEFEKKVNAELIGNFGNFVFRVLVFVRNNFNSTVPEPEKLGRKEKNLIKKITATKNSVKQLILQLKFRDALKKILALSKAGNVYFQSKKPWESFKENPEDCRTTLFVSVHLVKALAILFEPFIPFTSEKIWSQLNLEGSVHKQDFDSLDKLDIKAGHKIGKVEPLFKKFE
jgi:methionyl-tRNA synthetase